MIKGKDIANLLANRLPDRVGGGHDGGNAGVMITLSGWSGGGRTAWSAEIRRHFDG
jgi:hypothetical protein